MSDHGIDYGPAAHRCLAAIANPMAYGLAQVEGRRLAHIIRQGQCPASRAGLRALDRQRLTGNPHADDGDGGDGDGDGEEPSRKTAPRRSRPARRRCR